MLMSLASVLGNYWQSNVIINVW